MAAILFGRKRPMRQRGPLAAGAELAARRLCPTTINASSAGMPLHSHLSSSFILMPPKVPT